MREMEFKMERTGLVREGDVLPVNAFALSANFAYGYRLVSREGTVKEIKKTPKGFFVTVEFDE